MTASPPTIALTDAERLRIIAARKSAESTDVATLLSMLTDESWTVRREVVAALAGLGPSAVRPLKDVLIQHRDNEARIAAAVDALAASTADVSTEMAELAGHVDPAIAADAAQVLGRRRNPLAVPVLTALVSHDDDNVAVAAIEALGRIGGRSGVDTLIGAVKSRNFFRVFPAIDVLGRSGDPRAIAPLASLLADSTYVLEAARALGRTGEPGAVAPLSALLVSHSESTVRVAALALGELKTRHAERYGASDAPEDALRRAHPGELAIRRMVHGLPSADLPEQVALAWVLGALGGEVAVSGLRGLLDAPRPIAEAATGALKKLGRDSEKQIRDALREGGSARRQVLLRAVARASASAELVECLSDPDAAVRALACDALARVGAWATVPSIFPLLADANPRVVQAAIGAIQSLGSDDTQRLSLEAAVSPHAGTRRAAFRVLAYFGYRAALPLFLNALDDGDVRLREAAIAGLAFLDAPEALNALLECALRTDEKTRGAAMRALGQCSVKDPRIEASLLAGVTDDEPWVRYYACQALGRLRLESTTEALIPRLTDEAGQVRVAAVEALSHFTNDRALEALRRSAEGADADVQRAALIGLGASKRPEAYPILHKAAKSPDPATRLVAISAIAESQSEHALPALGQAVRDPDENVRSAALGFVAAVPTPEATALLIDLLRDGRDEPRIAQILAVSNEGRVPGLMHALETADDELAPRLTSALVRLQTAEARDAVFKAMKLPTPAARKAAAAALAAFRSPAAFQELRWAAENDPDDRVRQICLVLLA